MYSCDMRPSGIFWGFMAWFMRLVSCFVTLLYRGGGPTVLTDFPSVAHRGGICANALAADAAKKYCAVCNDLRVYVYGSIVFARKRWTRSSTHSRVHSDRPIGNCALWATGFLNRNDSHMTGPGDRNVHSEPRRRQKMSCVYRTLEMNILPRWGDFPNQQSKREQIVNENGQLHADGKIAHRKG